MKPLLFALCVVFACDSLSAQTPVWQHAGTYASADMAGARLTRSCRGPEVSRWWPAGRGGFTLGQLSQPTDDVYSPERKNTGPRWLCFLAGAMRSGHRSGRHGGLYC